MNEFYHLKMFFVTLYDNRIRPIYWFFKYQIIKPIHLSFMSEEQKQHYFDKQQAESIKNIERCLGGITALAVGNVVTSAVMGAVQEAKKEVRKSTKK